MEKLKKPALMLLMATAFLSGNAQNMEDHLKKNCKQLDTAMHYESVMKASSGLEMGAMKWGSEYIANYYAAYSKAVLSFHETDLKKKDLILDKADQYFEKVKTLGAEDDETFVLAAMLAQARMSVDGANRWQKYGKIFEENLDKAKAIDAENPRIYYLKGTSIFYTPKMFGGGKKNAKPYFEKAKELFAKQDTTTILKPCWGAGPNNYFMGQCENDKD